MELKKEDIIKVLENNTVWFEALYEDLIHKGRFEDIANEIVKLTIPVVSHRRELFVAMFDKMNDDDIQECINGFAGRVFDRVNNQ